jgi:hypothetical protein
VVHGPDRRDCGRAWSDRLLRGVVDRAERGTPGERPDERAVREEALAVDPVVVAAEQELAGCGQDGEERGACRAAVAGLPCGLPRALVDLGHDARPLRIGCRLGVRLPGCAGAASTGRERSLREAGANPRPRENGPGEKDPRGAARDRVRAVLDPGSDEIYAPDVVNPSFQPDHRALAADRVHEHSPIALHETSVMDPRSEHAVNHDLANHHIASRTG